MNSKLVEALEKDFVIQEGQSKTALTEAKDSCELSLHSLKYIDFIRQRISNEEQSFSLSDKFDLPPINALLSVRLEQFAADSQRIVVALFSREIPYLISKYFDKISISIEKEHNFEWTRNCDNLETDGIEFVLPKELELPATCTIILYPDFPVTYFNVPDCLFPVVGKKVAPFSVIIKAISAFASKNSLIGDDVLTCGHGLDLGFGVQQVPLGQVVYHVKSMLVPLQPMNVNLVITPEKPVYNYNLTLPDLSFLQKVLPTSVPEEIESDVQPFCEQGEIAEFLAAIGRNPVEALEAEICGHSAYCELSDESNDAGPKISVAPSNPARRSSVYYWQPWTSEHAARFLEENKQIHARYPSKK